jgi:hypothetical protein
MAEISMKAVAWGAVTASLALTSSAALALEPQFAGAAVFADPYNVTLSATMLTSEGTDARFSGRPAALDPYNARLASMLLSTTSVPALQAFADSYAFAADYQGPRIWEGLTWSDK